MDSLTNYLPDWETLRVNVVVTLALFRAMLSALVIDVWNYLFAPKPDPPSFADQLVAITGGAGGIGFELAREFLAVGSRVILLDCDTKAVEGAVDRLRLEFCGVTLENGDLGNKQTGSHKLDNSVEKSAKISCNFDKTKVTGLTCDVTDLSSMIHLADKIATDPLLGPVDVLICSAGILRVNTFESLTEKDIRATFEVNTLGSFWTVKAFLGQMTKNTFVKTDEPSSKNMSKINHKTILDSNMPDSTDFSPNSQFDDKYSAQAIESQVPGLKHIVLLSSFAGLSGQTLGTAYCASKFALRGFAESLRWELDDIARKQFDCQSKTNSDDNNKVTSHNNNTNNKITKFFKFWRQKEDICSKVRVCLAYPYFTRTTMLTALTPQSDHLPLMDSAQVAQAILQGLKEGRQDIRIPPLWGWAFSIKDVLTWRALARFREWLNIGFDDTRKYF